MKKGPFKMKGMSFKNSPMKIDLTRKKVAPMVGAPGGNPNFKQDFKKLTNKKKDLFIGPKSPKSPSTRFNPPPAPGNKSKGTLRGITGFEYDFPKANKLIDLKINSYKKGFNTIKKTGKKIKDYFTKK